MEPGQVWGYRKRANATLEPVRIVRRGTARPKWALVAFESPEAEGAQEWVPIGRLKVPWGERGDFLAREARWEAATAASIGVTEAQEWAAGTVFDLLDAERRVDYSAQARAGVSKITDPVAFTHAFGIEYSSLLAEPTAFEEDGAVVMPWAGTERLARTLATLHPRRVLEAVQLAEAAAEAKAVADIQRYSMSMIPTAYRNEQPLDAARTEQESRDLVRQWCCHPALDQWHDLQGLRREVARLGSIIAKAASVLEAKGYKRDATEIRKLHGIAHETLEPPKSYVTMRADWERNKGTETG